MNRCNSRFVLHLELFGLSLCPQRNERKRNKQNEFSLSSTNSISFLRIFTQFLLRHFSFIVFRLVSRLSFRCDCSFFGTFSNQIRLLHFVFFYGFRSHFNCLNMTAIVIYVWTKFKSARNVCVVRRQHHENSRRCDHFWIWNFDKHLVMFAHSFGRLIFMWEMCLRSNRSFHFSFVVVGLFLEFLFAVCISFSRRLL